MNTEEESEFYLEDPMEGVDEYGGTLKLIKSQGKLLELEVHEEHFAATLGLPEEIVLVIFCFLPPKDRTSSAHVCKVWTRLIHESWKVPFGELIPSLGFHSLMQGKILRQSIPHVSWRIPHVEDLPVNIPVYSPTFVQPFYHHEHVHLHWRLRLERLSKDVAPEDSDLRLYVDLVRPPDALFDDTPHEFSFYGRAHNPASYSWSEFKLKRHTMRTDESVQVLSLDHQSLTSPNKGFRLPPDCRAIELKVMIAPTSCEYVTVFLDEDIQANKGADLFLPTSHTLVLHMPIGWSKSSQTEAQKALYEELVSMFPKHNFDEMEFWRVIMRRNHSFRPVSPELRSYEEPYYAVYAHRVPRNHHGKICLFLKYYDGKTLTYVGKAFVNQQQTMRDILSAQLDGEPVEDFRVFEEVHARRLDPVDSLDTSIARTLELGNGDVLVFCAKEQVTCLHEHYKSLVYTSPLVTVQPNMWHS